MRRMFLLLVISTVLAFGPRPQAQEPSATLKKLAEFDLPGPAGKRFDYLTIDPEDHYLISAHLAAGQTYLIDLRTHKVIATVADTPGAEGVEAYFFSVTRWKTHNSGHVHLQTTSWPDIDARSFGGARVALAESINRSYKFIRDYDGQLWVWTHNFDGSLLPQVFRLT